ncbi:NAD(P)H-dependent oxidoreductase [Heyndrickxia sporothermodurans]|uniref:flavodoxin family protein n=1 Tax=Heyndrickxia sporothermodurans TaxID=46224 RepID=UPI000D3A13F9|nr:flavodoxin family protein [Heyndrickxia sporothermodurans]PTY77879.1 NAD(P)H-dependent oxidoreductase [Heyndrickxia sporothermodurans]
MTIAVIYGGTRPNGNAETLTDLAINGLEVEKIYLGEYLIQPIKDGRHSEEGFQEVSDDYNSIINRLLPHDTWIFSTPIYWYSMSGIMKNFIDRWSQTMRDTNYPEFKTQMSKKKAYVIAVGGDEPYMKGLPMIQQFQHIFDFMGMSFEGYVLGEGNKPGDILNDKKAVYAATELLRR